MTVSRFSEQ